MFITNNHLRFNCVERKIWPNIKKSQNIMTMIVDSSFRHSKTPKDIYKLFSAFFRKIFCRGWAIKGMSYYNDMWSKSEMKLRLTLSWGRLLSYRNQSFHVFCKTNDCFLHKTQHWTEMSWAPTSISGKLHNEQNEVVSIFKSI